MGNCECAAPQTKDKQKMLNVDINQDIPTSVPNGKQLSDLKCRSEKCVPLYDAKTKDNSSSLNRDEDNQSNPNLNIVINRKRKPKTLMARHSTFLNRTAIQIAVLGPVNVGKTSFLSRFCQNKYDNDYEHSTSDELMMKRYPYNSRLYEIRMTIQNGDIDKSDFAHNDFVILMYDLSNPETLINAKELFERKLKGCVQPHENGLSNVVLLGNKADSNAVRNSNEDVKVYCEEQKIEFFEVSVKENKGIAVAMAKLIEAFDNDVFKFVQ